MNKKGFTLVELLAVIVIIALLGLIVSTSVVKIINNSRQDMYENQILSIKNAAEVWGGENINLLPNEGECIYMTLGYLKNYGLIDDNVLDSRTNDKINDDLKIKITNNINNNYKSNIKYEVDVTNDEIKECKLWSPVCVRANKMHEEICQLSNTSNFCGGLGYDKGSTIKYGNKTVTNGILNSGDAFDCDVNNDGIYDDKTERFYYVSDYYDNKTNSFDDKTAVLIYYNNVTVGVPDNTNSSLTAYNNIYSNKNNFGPVTALSNLPSTSLWKNVSLKRTKRQIVNELGNTVTTAGNIANFDYSGYAARLLTIQELNNACNISNSNTIITSGVLSNCEYLMENTKFVSSTMGTYGYWLETPISSSNSYVYFVFGNSNHAASETAVFGIRPVIELSKEQIFY